MIWWSRRRVQIREPSTWPKAITHRHARLTPSSPCRIGTNDSRADRAEPRPVSAPEPRGITVAMLQAIRHPLPSLGTPPPPQHDGQQADQHARSPQVPAISTAMRAAVGSHSRWCRPAPGSLRRRAALRCAVMLVRDPPERPVRWQGESGEDLAGDGGVGRVEAVQVFRRTACRGSRDKAKLAVAVLSGDVGNGQESAMAYRPGSRR